MSCQSKNFYVCHVNVCFQFQHRLSHYHFVLNILPLILMPLYWLQCVVILCHVENVSYYTLLNCEVTMIDKMLPNCKCMYACLVLSFSLVAIMTIIYITSYNYCISSTLISQMNFMHQLDSQLHIIAFILLWYCHLAVLVKTQPLPATLWLPVRPPILQECQWY